LRNHYNRYRYEVLHIYPLFRKLLDSSTTLIDPNHSETLDLVETLNDVSENNPDDDDPIDSVLFSKAAGKLYSVDVDYMYRPQTLDNLNLYAFKRHLVKCSYKSASFLFQHQHPQTLTHGLKLRSAPIIPNVSMRIPSRTTQDEEKQREYRCIIFLLFTPWRHLKDEWRSFNLEVFLQNAPSLIHSYITNMDSLASSREEAERLNRLRKLDSVNEDNEISPLDSAELHDYDLNATDLAVTETIENDLDATWHLNFSTSQLDHSLLQASIAEKSEFIKEPLTLLKDILNHEAAMPALPMRSPSILPFEPDSKVWTKQLKTLCSPETEDIITPPQRSSKKRKTIEVAPVTDATTNLSGWTDPAITKAFVTQSAQIQCPISDAVSAFNLNHEQLKAVIRIGNHLLRLQATILSKSNDSVVDPLRIFISGQGGTGKTHVINSIKYLFTHFNADKLLSCSAPTGVAAFNINSPTTAALFQSGIDTSLKGLTSKVVDKLRDSIQSTEYFLIDEASMLGQAMLYRIHKSLQLVHNNRLLFGGKTMILIGDFLQLAPVCATPLYKTILNVANAEPSPGNIWTHFREHIKLLNQMRAAGSPVLLQILNEARLHHLSIASHQILMSRLIENNKQIDLTHPDWVNAPILVTRNALREQINLLRHRSHCRVSGVTEYVIAAQDYLQNDLLSPTLQGRLCMEESKCSSLTGKTDTLGDRTPKTLHISKGARIVLTVNMKVEFGLVNGATGTIFEILLPPSVSPYRNRAAPNCVFLARPPIVLFKPDVCHPALANFKFSGLDSFPPGLVPLFPKLRTFTFKCFTDGGHLETKSIQRYQLDLDLAYALTDYKCQGKTYTNAIIDLRAPPGKQTDPNSPYVLLSRLKSIEGLLILRSFDPDVFNKPLASHLLAQLEKESRATSFE
jgi:hypothetical protein